MTKYIDPNTGLPTVPEGHFWRVTPASSGGYFRIQLRKKTFLGFSRTVEWTVMQAPLFDAKLRREAFYVLGKIEANKRTILSLQNDEKYVGSYPPKTINLSTEDNDY